MFRLDFHRFLRSAPAEDLLVTIELTKSLIPNIKIKTVNNNNNNFIYLFQHLGYKNKIKH